MRAVLIDTGPLVALLDRSDHHHESMTEALTRVQDPLVSVWPVLVEAMYLLGSSWRAQKALWEMFESGAVRLLSLAEDDLPHLKGLMEKYRDLPMDLADAALVRVAEREGIRRILTLDRRDFSVYQLTRKGGLTILP